MGMKVMATVNVPPGTSAADARSRCLDRPPGWTLNLCDARRAGDTLAVVSMPVSGAGEVPLVEGAVHAWLVEERPQWDGLAASAGAGTAGAASAGPAPLPGYKQISFLHRAADLDRAAFASAWVAHSALARVHHPLLWRYTQNIVVRSLLAGTPDIDGIAELTMRLRLDFTEGLYDSPEGRRIIGEDTRRFIDRSRGWRLMTREYQRS